MKQLITVPSGRVCSVIWESDRVEKRSPLFWRLAFNLDKFIIIGG
jgi:hypothetical protein